jgi:hypothetical protein
MKKFIALLFTVLLFWPTLQASSEIGQGLSTAVVQIINNDGEKVIIYLDKDKKFDTLILDGYQQLYMAPDSPWPLPDTTKHP